MIHNNIAILIITGSIYFILLDELIIGSVQRRIGPLNLGWYGILSSIINGCNLITTQLIIPKLHFYFGFQLFPIFFFLFTIISYSIIYPFYLINLMLSLVLILYLLLMNVKLRIHLSLLILSSFFSNSTFFIPIFLDFFIIFPIFFFKGPINSIEVFNSFNSCYSILFINFFSLFFQIQFIILVIIYALNL